MKNTKLFTVEDFEFIRLIPSVSSSYFCKHIEKMCRLKIEEKGLIDWQQKNLISVGVNILDSHLICDYNFNN
jgi:hypothetical protein